MATTSGARSPSPHLAARCAASTLPCRVLLPAASLPAAASTFDAPMFDPPLQSAANSTASSATISGKVAAAFSAAASVSFDDFALFSLLLLLPRVAARRRGAVRRRPRRLRQCSSAAAMFAQLGRAARPSPAAPAALGGSSVASRVPLLLRKKPRDIEAFFSLLRRRMRRACTRLNRAHCGLSNGIGVSGGLV